MGGVTTTAGAYVENEPRLGRNMGNHSFVDTCEVHTFPGL